MGNLMSFGPEGYERDTRKKSRGLPTKTTSTDVKTETTDDTARQQGFVSQGGGGGAYTPSPVDKRQTPPTETRQGEPPKPLRITEVYKRDGVLTIAFKAIFQNSTHNYLYIVIDGFKFHTPALFFGQTRLALNETRRVTFRVKRLNARPYVLLERQAYPSLTSNHMFPLRTHPNQFGHETIADFNIKAFRIQLQNYGENGTLRDSITQADIDTDGNRIGSVRGAPSIKRTLIGTWATLKKAGL